MYDLAAVDIGNSTIRIGYFIKDKLEHITSVKTRFFRGKIHIKPSNQIIVSSVVPKINKIIKQDYRKARFVYHSDLSFSGVRENIGIDRLINTYAAQKLYKRDVVVIDFGSAITLSAVKDNEFKGGVICPGYDTMLRSLHNKTAQLPLVQESQIGVNLLNVTTADAISAGCFYMVKYGIEAMIDTVTKKLNIKSGVVATGGNCLIFHDQINRIDIINPTLLLEGLWMLSEYL